MTTAVAIRVLGETWIASDSMVTLSGQKMAAPFQKWRRNAKNCWYAFSGHTRIYDLVDDDDEFNQSQDAREFINRARLLAQQDGWSVTDGKGEPTDYAFDAIFIDADGDVHFCHGSGAVHWFDDNICAIGSGREYAYGAAHGMIEASLAEHDPETFLTVVIEAASKYDSGTGGDVFVHKVG